MTKNEILAMSAGIKLDALVAETMGYKAYKEKRGGFEIAVMQKPGDREPWTRSKNQQPERYTEITCLEAVGIGFYGTGFPEYSTNISSAWEVFMSMKTRLLFSKRQMFMKELQRLASKDKLQAEDSLIAFPDVFWYITPEIICKAALLTVLEGEV